MKPDISDSGKTDIVEDTQNDELVTEESTEDNTEEVQESGIEDDDNQEIPLLSAVNELADNTASQSMNTEVEEESESILNKELTWVDYLTIYPYSAPGVQDAFWEVYLFKKDGTYEKDIYTVDGEYSSVGGTGTYYIDGDALILDDGAFKYTYHSKSGVFYMAGDSWESRAVLEPELNLDCLTEEYWQEQLDLYYYNDFSD